MPRAPLEGSKGLSARGSRRALSSRATKGVHSRFSPSSPSMSSAGSGKCSSSAPPVKESSGAARQRRRLARKSSTSIRSTALANPETEDAASGDDAVVEGQVDINDKGAASVKVNIGPSAVVKMTKKND
jgi:hypothetical protein